MNVPASPESSAKPDEQAAVDVEAENTQAPVNDLETRQEVKSDQEEILPDLEAEDELNRLKSFIMREMSGRNIEVSRSALESLALGLARMVLRDFEQGTISIDTIADLLDEGMVEKYQAAGLSLTDIHQLYWAAHSNLTDVNG